MWGFLLGPKVHNWVTSLIMKCLASLVATEIEMENHVVGWLKWKHTLIILVLTLVGHSWLWMRKNMGNDRGKWFLPYDGMELKGCSAVVTALICFKAPLHLMRTDTTGSGWSEEEQSFSSSSCSLSLGELSWGLNMSGWVVVSEGPEMGTAGGQCCSHPLQLLQGCEPSLLPNQHDIWPAQAQPRKVRWHCAQRWHVTWLWHIRILQRSCPGRIWEYLLRELKVLFFIFCST